MKCADAQPLFSSYLDGAVTGRQMHAVGQHIESCPKCHREYMLLAKTQRMLVGLGRAKAPLIWRCVYGSRFPKKWRGPTGRLSKV